MPAEFLFKLYTLDPSKGSYSDGELLTPQPLEASPYSYEATVQRPQGHAYLFEVDVVSPGWRATPKSGPSKMVWIASRPSQGGDNKKVHDKAIEALTTSWGGLAVFGWGLITLTMLGSLLLLCIYRSCVSNVCKECIDWCRTRPEWFKDRLERAQREADRRLERAPQARRGLGLGPEVEAAGLLSAEDITLETIDFEEASAHNNGIEFDEEILQIAKSLS